MHLSVVVPAFNEAKNLNKNIRLFNNYLAGQHYSYEIIIVNDGSRDNTKAIAEQLESDLESVRIIGYEKNRGKGCAIRAGFKIARGDYVLFLDADGATSIEHVEFIWDEFKNGAAVVIGSRNPRDATKAKIVVAQAGWKQLLGKTGNRLIQAITGIRIRDTQCGFKAFSRRAIDTIFKKTTINGWALDIEIIILAQLNNLKLSIIPVEWTNVEGSRVGFKGYFITLKEILEIKINHLTKKYQ